MCIHTTNQNQQKPFSEEQLFFLGLHQEEALELEQLGQIKRIDVTEEMIADQERKIAEAKIQKQEIDKKMKKKSYARKFWHTDKELIKYSKEWFAYMWPRIIALHPDVVAEEGLKALKLGIEPRDSFVHHQVYF